MTSNGNPGSKNLLLGRILSVFLISGMVPVLALLVQSGQWLLGDTLLCKIHGIKVIFLKCDSEMQAINPQKTDDSITNSIVLETPTSNSTLNSELNGTEVLTNKANSTDSTTEISQSNKNLLLKDNFLFQERVDHQFQEKYYLFSLQNPSHVNLYLYGVTSQVWMGLYVDTNGNGLVDSNEYLADANA